MVGSCIVALERKDVPQLGVDITCIGCEKPARAPEYPALGVDGIAWANPPRSAAFPEAAPCAHMRGGSSPHVFPSSLRGLSDHGAKAWVNTCIATGEPRRCCISCSTSPG